VLNSYEDFTPLREVIVGSAENYLSQERDLTFELFHHESLPLCRRQWRFSQVFRRLGGTDLPAPAASTWLYA
jgi:glycine amidinotransferase